MRFVLLTSFSLFLPDKRLLQLNYLNLEFLVIVREVSFRFTL